MMRDNGKKLLVPVGLEQRLRVGTVVLAPASIRPHEVRWEQDDVVSQPSQRPCPEVSRAAGFEKHGGSALFGKERRCLRCLLLVMCTYPFAKKSLTLYLARSEGNERYFGCNLMHRKVLASSRQHLMAEAPVSVSTT